MPKPEARPTNTGERSEKGETVKYNSCYWQFPKLTEEEFDAVATRAFEIFWEEIPKGRAINHISTRTERKSISFYPHVGRGLSEDDLRIKRAIDRFNSHLQENKIPCKTQPSFQDVRSL